MQRLLNKIRHGLKPSQYPGYPEISNSTIQHLELISRHAIIENSHLCGPVTIGDHSKIIDAKLAGQITIGRWTTFNGPHSDIYSQIDAVKIGNFCSIARHVSIQEYNHRIERLTSYFVMANVFGETMRSDIASKGPILIGNDVWIGTQSVILSSAVISDGVVVGANSVVDCFIPPYAIAVGSPARIVRYRFSEPIIEKLLEIQWWNWDDEKIRRNRELFTSPLTNELLHNIAS